MASAATPAWQSAGSACSAGEWETPVGLRTNSIALGTPADARIPASCPAPVGRIGRAAERPRRPGRAGPRRSRRPGVHDSSTLTSAPAARGQLGHDPVARDRGLVGAAGVQPGADRQGIGVGAVRATRDLPKVATAPRRSAASRAAQHGPGEAAASGRRGLPGGWCPRGWPAPRKSNRQRPCGQIAEATPTGASRSTRPAPARRGARRTSPTRPQGLGVAAQLARVAPGPAQHLAPASRPRRRSGHGPGPGRARR